MTWIKLPSGDVYDATTMTLYARAANGLQIFPFGSSAREVDGGDGAALYAALSALAGGGEAARKPRCANCGAEDVCLCQACAKRALGAASPPASVGGASKDRGRDLDSADPLARTHNCHPALYLARDMGVRCRLCRGLVYGVECPDHPTIADPSVPTRGGGRAATVANTANDTGAPAEPTASGPSTAAVCGVCGMSHLSGPEPCCNTRAAPADDGREAFEAWARGEGRWNLRRNPDITSLYKDDDTTAAWLGWQAARDAGWTRDGEVVAIEGVIRYRERDGIFYIAEGGDYAEFNKIGDARNCGQRAQVLIRPVDAKEE